MSSRTSLAGFLGVAFTTLFLAGLVPVTLIAADTHFPSPLQPAHEVAVYFQANAARVGVCAFLHFASALVLGGYAAVITGRLRSLGVGSSALDIASFGGAAAALMTLVSSLGQWTLAQGGVVAHEATVQALYFVLFAAGGPGYSVPLGLLLGGASLAARSSSSLPRWVTSLGLGLGAIGVLSALSLVVPKALFLVPLTRFPGFVWLIAVGFKLR